MTNWKDTKYGRRRWHGPQPRGCRANAHFVLPLSSFSSFSVDRTVGRSSRRCSTSSKPARRWCRSRAWAELSCGACAGGPFWQARACQCSVWPWSSSASIESISRALPGRAPTAEKTTVYKQCLGGPRSPLLWREGTRKAGERRARPVGRGAEVEATPSSGGREAKSTSSGPWRACEV